MALMEFEITDADDEKHLVRIGYTAIVAAERFFRKGFDELKQTMEFSLWVAHHQLKFESRTNLSFDEWVRSVELVLPAGKALAALEADAENPTQPQPQPAGPIQQSESSQH